MHQVEPGRVRYAFLLVLLALTATSLEARIFRLINVQPMAAKAYVANLEAALETDEYLYADYLSFSIDSPDARVERWKSSIDATAQYDKTFGQTKRIIRGNPAFTVTLSTKTESLPMDLHLLVSYYTNKSKQFVQQSLVLTQNTPTTSTNAAPAAVQVPAQENIVTPADQTAPAPQPTTQKASWSDALARVATRTTSWWFRIAIAFVLGLLLSLTPCIYPMVPITVGILQAQASPSLLGNFLLALAYSTGLASTFALLGLGAAFAGHLVGSLLTNPWVIAVIIALLVYIALSLFGLYELYIPRSLRNRGDMGKSSYVSAFLFGAASGTVASPCLSPGLILMLTLVATLNNVLLGFVMLFAFGFGLSIPLLVIGTFSTSLRMLPQAGSWMLEINYLFGFMLFAMALYFLQGILPWSFVLALGAVLSLSTAVFYLWRSSGERTLARGVHQAMALVCIGLAGFLAVRSATHFLITKAVETMPIQTATWLHDYAQGRAEAQKQNKKLFVDISAPMCSACTAVDKVIFSKQQVMQELSHFVAVKIDIADMPSDARTQLMQKFNIMGAPTVLLIDPTSEKVIARWSSELAERTAASFIAELARYR